MNQANKPTPEQRAAGRLTYTDGPPTVAGWYWWRLHGSTILKVIEWPGGGFAVHMPGIAEHSDGWTTPGKIGGEWCGPLLSPE